MKDTIPNENFVAYNIFTFDGFISNSMDGFISLSQKTLPRDNFRRFGHLLFNQKFIKIKKVCLLFTDKILLDFNEYLSFYEHISLTAVPRMLRGTRHFFPNSIIYKHF